MSVCLQPAPLTNTRKRPLSSQLQNFQRFYYISSIIELKAADRRLSGGLSYQWVGSTEHFHIILPFTVGLQFHPHAIPKGPLTPSSNTVSGILESYKRRKSFSRNIW